MPPRGSGLVTGTVISLIVNFSPVYSSAERSQPFTRGTYTTVVRDLSYACAIESVEYPSCVGIPEGGIPKSTWLNVVCLYNLLG